MIFKAVFLSPVPVGGVVGDSSLVDAALGQCFLLVQDELLQTHLHLCACHRTLRGTQVRQGQVRQGQARQGPTTITSSEVDKT